MSFPRYPEYKDSGVEWLGEVPGHWEVRPIKAMAMLKGGDGFPDAEQGVENEELYFYKVAALGQADAKGILQAPPDSVSRDTAKRLGAFVFPAGSLTFAKVGAALLLARIRQLPAPSCLDNNMMGMLVNKVNDTRFVLFAMSLVRFDLIANPGAVPSLNASQIGNFQLALPPLAEQTAIATFLDRETSKIDALVAEQEKLIALLQEKRQAVISHAVTKGLDPNVTMKDSGVEWLGEVPGHWQVKALKFIATVQTGIAKGKDNTGKETITVPYLRVANVQDGYLALDDMAEIEIPASDLQRYLLQPGDVLMNEGGDFDKLGRGYIWRGEVASCIHQNHVFAVRPHGVSSEWLNAISGSAYAQFYFMTRSKQSTNLASISSTSIMELPVLLPPLDEQSAVLIFMATQTSQFDALMAEARAAVALLQERRTALISAAVTGQIDVRGITSRDVS